MADTSSNAKPDRRFIEESFPVKEVGVASAREKNIRHGHISTLHIWWARRPLAASRATAYAALTPAPKDIEEWQRKRDFIIDLCKWENSNNQQLLEKARQDILDANGGVPPKVLDPFAGGGSYPLEAMRLGCEAYASDYNPVAVLIEKATLEYPQKFGRQFESMPNWAYPILESSSSNVSVEERIREEDIQPFLFDIAIESKTFNPLINAVHFWGKWVLEEARKELAEFYPSDPDGSILVGYLWARTIPCQNPACGSEIPLMRQFWLSKKERKRIALFPRVKNGGIEFLIVGEGYDKWPNNYDPENGTVSQAVATCLSCGTIIDDTTVRHLFQNGKSGQRLIAVVLKNKNQKGKFYRVANQYDEFVYSKALARLADKRERLMLEWGLDPVPDEIIHTPDDREYEPGGLLYNFTPILLYGMTHWGDLFNARQQLSLITFAEKVKLAYSLMMKSEANSELAKAVGTYLGLGVDELARFTSVLNPWKVDAEAIVHIFGRQAIPMLWDYNENNPLGSHGGTWTNRLSEMMDVVSNLTGVSENSCSVSQSSATQVGFADESLHAIFTDPPYYDNVPYSDLSDFFYVWLKRTVGNLHPELFSTPLTPKSLEAIAELPLLRGMNKIDAVSKIQGIKTSEHFEEMLGRSFQEIKRVLKKGGIAVIVYAHKSTEGWETIINALLDSGLVVTAAWPISTEMGSRLRARESAALASSIYIVTCKMERKATGIYNEVRSELRYYLNSKLQRLWEEGIIGADFFIAAIGSAIEVFGKYEQVIDYEGNVVRADRLLEEVRDIATD